MTLFTLAALAATATTVDLPGLGRIVASLVTFAIVREILAFLRGRGGPRERE
jgi:hypothetical protein